MPSDLRRGLASQAFRTEHSHRHRFAEEGAVRASRYLLLLIGPTLLTGCGSRLAPVKGQITCNGKPFFPAAVLFSPMPEKEGDRESGQAASRRTDEQGHYVLTTFKQGDGALIGKHRVTINVEYPDRPYPCKGYDKQEIIFEVKPGNNEINIRLEDYQKK